MLFFSQQVTWLDERALLFWEHNSFLIYKVDRDQRETPRELPEKTHDWKLAIMAFLAAFSGWKYRLSSHFERSIYLVSKPTYLPSWGRSVSDWFFLSQQYLFF